MPDFENEKNLFLDSKLIKSIKFKTLDYYFDAQLLVFKDITLNLMWHAWLASVQRVGFMLVPKEPTEEMLGAAWEAPPAGGPSGNRRVFYEKQTVVYKAMIKAAETN